MRKVSPNILAISNALVAHEARPRRVAAADVCEKLRPKLSMLMGATGFRTLLTRALALACGEMPTLIRLHVDTEGALVSSEGAASEDRASDAMLVAQLLSLLVAFIGEGLTRQILVEIWPQLPGVDNNFETGERA